MRRANGRNGRDVVAGNTLETINAAASAIASAQNRVSQPTFHKKRWGSWLNISGCFGYQKNRKRIGHAVLVPETPPPHGADSAAATVSSNQAPSNSITLPFIAPPSSPASFFQSESSSIAQSPAGTVSLTTSVSASMYSPGGPASIFAIGPYAHETQLVSPPVFSASSTAPFTPPPESVHLTTPSSPEVPFAQLLDPNYRNTSEAYQRFQISHYDFQSYQFHPGSPLGQLISPRSAFSASGTSSPFPDSEFTAGGGFHNLDLNHKSNQGSGSLTPDAVKSTTQAGFLPNHWVSEIKMSPHSNEISVNHRVSFELSAQKVLRSVENKPAASALCKVLSKLKNEADKEENSRETGCKEKQLAAETTNDASKETVLDGDEATVEEKDQSLVLSSAKEFNFDNADGGGDSHAPNIVADWWANEKVAGKEGGASKNWSFFQMVQPSSVS